MVTEYSGSLDGEPNNNNSEKRKRRKSKGDDEDEIEENSKKIHKNEVPAEGKKN